MKQQNKNFLAAFMGTALEFYDFALFGFFAATLSTLFFPKEEPVAALIASYSIFAAGFFMRPLGGIFFGYIGDTFGRKRAMLISIVAMMIPTSLIGLLPTYAQIGLMAPIILALCRLLQGLCTGGEFSGAAIFVIEHAKDRKIFAGSLVTASSVVGMLLGSSFASLFSMAELPDWSWRIPFVLSVFIGLLGLYIRKNTSETTEFENESKKATSETLSFFQIATKRRTACLATFGIGGFIGVLYYVPFVFMGHYLSLVSPLSLSSSLMIVTMGLLVYMACICLAGYYADTIGPQKIMLTSAFASVIFAMPAIWLIKTGQFSLILQGQLILSILAGTFVGPANGLTASLFNVKDRCRGVSFSLSLGIALFGGMTPVVLVTFVSKIGLMFSPAYWLMFGAIMGFSAVWLSRQIGHGFRDLASDTSAGR